MSTLSLESSDGMPTAALEPRLRFFPFWMSYPLSVGPIEVHAEDAISIASNELDRREACARRISYDRPAIQRAISPVKT